MSGAPDTPAHALLDAHPTNDGYGLRCTCGMTWEWNPDMPCTLDDMAAAAREHVEVRTA